MAGWTWDKDGAMVKKMINLRTGMILVLLAGWLSGATFSACADTSDWIWVPTDPSVPARSFHNAVPVKLKDGGDGVMMIGGLTQVSQYEIPPVARSVVYNTDRGRWDLGPLLQVPRYATSATLFGNSSNRVLVVGGYKLNKAVIPWRIDSNETCELLDPNQTTGIRTGNLNEARYWHAATLLTAAGPKQNRVLVAGGINKWVGIEPIFLASSELYNPDNETWTPTKGSLSLARELATAVELTAGKDAGKVLLIGGAKKVVTSSSISYPAVRSCELYDPEKDSWDNATPLNYPRVMHTATLLDDGRILVAGGVDMVYEWVSDPSQKKHLTELYRSYEIYNPDNNTWTCPTDQDETKHLRHRRAGHTATLLGDGTVLVVDGYTSEIYDPKKDTWTFTRETLNYPRSFHTSTLLKNSKDPEQSKVLVFGGGPTNGELFEPSSTLIRSVVSRPLREVPPSD